MASIIIFTITYTFIAIGRIPRLVIDRTGIALLGAIAMIVFKVLSLESATNAIDFSTIILLFGLMILSAQFRLAGFYRWSAIKISTLIDRPKLFLFIMMLISGLLSSILTNDVICLAFTPLIIFAIAKEGRLNPVPYLIGLAISSNIGSALTIIGNPQNILIAQVGRLDFLHFTLWSFTPTALSMMSAFMVISLLYRNKFHQKNRIEKAVLTQESVTLDKWQCFKGIFLTIVLILLFFTNMHREISVMIIAGIILCSRKITTSNIFNLIDWKLLILFCSLFIVIKGISVDGHSRYVLNLLNSNGYNMDNPFTLAVTSGIMGNIFSNVPSTMLLLKLLNSPGKELYYVLSLSATYCGNFLIIGSIANLIVVEQAKVHGIYISFTEYLKTGWIVTTLSFIILFLWILVI